MESSNQRLKVSEDMYELILDYYKYLYKNYEIKTIKEIATSLDLSSNIIEDFLLYNYHGPNEKRKLNSLDKIILLCTKFADDCKYKQDQKLLQDEMMRRRVWKCIIDGHKKVEEIEESEKVKTI